MTLEPAALEPEGDSQMREKELPSKWANGTQPTQIGKRQTAQQIGKLPLKQATLGATAHSSTVAEDPTQPSTKTWTSWEVVSILRRMGPAGLLTHHVC